MVNLQCCFIMPIQKTNKEEIVATCKEVFHRRGYFNTGMSDLAKACGLMKGSFYHYFGSKEEIMKEVLLCSQKALNEQVLALGKQTSLEPKQRLSAVIGLITYHVSEFRSCLFGNTTLETSLLVPEFQQILRRIFQDIQETLTEIYASKYTVEEASKKAWHTIQQVQGAVMMMKLYDDPTILQEAKQYLLDSY